MTGPGEIVAGLGALDHTSAPRHANVIGAEVYRGEDARLGCVVIVVKD